MLEEEEVLQHSGSILGSVILCGTSRRISQLWDNAHALNLENCLLYLSFTISQFFDLNRCIVFDFIFYCVTAHTFVSRERNAAFLNFVPVDFEITKTVFVFSTAVQIVDTEIS